VEGYSSVLAEQWSSVVRTGDEGILSPLTEISRDSAARGSCYTVWAAVSHQHSQFGGPYEVIIDI
jgi:hypothetical protein